MRRPPVLSSAVWFFAVAACALATSVAAFAEEDVATAGQAKSARAGTIAGKPSTTSEHALHWVLAEAERLYRVRNAKESSVQAVVLLREAQQRFPDSPEVSWRLARALFWEAVDEERKDARRQLGEECLALADAAVARASRNARGHFARAMCLGVIMQSVSPMTVLRRGLDTKFRDAILRTLELDPKFGGGVAHQALGRYHFELPWPLRDVDESARLYRQALMLNPHDIRSRVWLAEALAAKSRKAYRGEIDRLLKEALEAPLGRYDLPEEVKAKALLPEVLRRLGVEGDDVEGI